MEFEKIVEEFKRIEEVTAIVLGGSRAKNTNDEKSDYDVYIYYDSPVSKDIREEILKKYCKHMEIAVNYFEEEDDCIMNSDVAIELIYRQFDTFEKSIILLSEYSFDSSSSGTLKYPAISVTYTPGWSSYLVLIGNTKPKSLS